MKKKTIILLILGIILILAGIFLYQKYKLTPEKVYTKQYNLKAEDFCIKNNKKYCFTLEIAKTKPERAKGLMFRKELPENAGMIFVFENEGIHPFWMKNTYIPLCMIRLDKNYKIVEKHKAYPCGEEMSKINACKVYSNTKPAKYVVELNLKFCDLLDTGNTFSKK